MLEIQISASPKIILRNFIQKLWILIYFFYFTARTYLISYLINVITQAQQHVQTPFSTASMMVSNLRSFFLIESTMEFVVRLFIVQTKWTNSDDRYRDDYNF